MPSERPYDGVNARCGLRGFVLHAGWAFPAGVIGTSICRTVPQAGFASLQDDIVENLLEDYVRRL